MNKINKHFMQGSYSVNKDFIFFNGCSIDINGKEKDSMIKLSRNQYVEFSYYSQSMKGILIKINQKTVDIMDDQTNKIYKYSIEKLIIKNRLPKTYYRIEHKDTGVGPFQTELYDFTHRTSYLSELYNKRLDELRNSPLSYPPPSIDNDIRNIWNNLTTEQRKEYKFACLDENQLYNWFGVELMHELLNNSFIIKKLVQNIDFSHFYFGSNQILLKMIEKSEI